MNSALRWLAVASLAIFTQASCVSGASLKARAEGLAGQLDALEGAAYRCAERELAMARSSLAFSKLELQQGNYLRAREHLDLSIDFYRQADAASRAAQCQTADRDGDGVPDATDLCPDVPEDKDGYEDEDGCPEDQDTDGDGIADSRDQCPNDPEDFDGDRDEDGCPDLVADRDGDGIGDSVDQCPDEPEDKDGFRDEDGCPDRDNDGDGIADSADKCPLEAEDKDEFEDADGCPDLDNDKDRIPDVKDRCPLQPEDYDGDSDEDGCPDVYKNIVVTGDMIELKQKVYFKTGKARILSRSYPMLNEIALALRDNPAMRVRIEGHTDSQGSERYNERLSEKRARAVRRYLSKQGVAGDRMQAVGMGESSPIEDNRTRDGRAANRRVEFHIIK